MEKYVSVELNNFGMGSPLNCGTIYIHEQGEESKFLRVSFEEGLRAMAKLAHALHRAPKQSINWYNTSISYRSLSGYVTE